MSEPSWFDYIRGARPNCFTAGSYLTTALLLFWPGWILSRKINNDWGRTILRAGLVAIAFAPAVFMDPGGIKSIIPASLAAIVSTILYIASNRTIDFYAYHALISWLLVWCAGIIAGEMSIKVKQKVP